MYHEHYMDIVTKVPFSNSYMCKYPKYLRLYITLTLPDIEIPLQRLHHCFVAQNFELKPPISPYFKKKKKKSNPILIYYKDGQPIGIKVKIYIMKDEII